MGNVIIIIIIFSLLGYIFGDFFLRTVTFIFDFVVMIIIYLIYKDDKKTIENHKKQLKKQEDNIINWSEKPFSKYLGKDILYLRYDSLILLDKLENDLHVFSDYSFVVSPFAKAYEGFLKKILVDVGAISKDELKSKPSLSVNSYFHPVEGSMVKYTSDAAREKAIPAVIYTVYQECRNEIMHFDIYQHPSKKAIRNIEEAKFFIKRIEDAIEKTYYTFIEPLKKSKKIKFVLTIEDNDGNKREQEI
ncbi:MAG: hypothetical protein ACEQSA_01100 [Weeksellaceae bacterium]